MRFVSLPSPPTIFPTYLVPALPFRRRKSSTDSNTSATSTNSTTPDSSSSSSSSSSSESETYLTSATSHLRCSRCLSDLALSTQIISKGFTGRHGRAYLVAPSPSSSSTTSTSTTPTLPNLPNTYTYKPVPRQLVTGPHTVGDISCAQCGSVLGWKYVAAEHEEQKYKVGKFILETRRVCRSSMWESTNEHEAATTRTAAGLRNKEVVDDLEFDSQDEDECDALFAGQWTPQFARSVRKEKKGFQHHHHHHKSFARLSEV
ncbi:Hypothetical predicted protein [Lecanosticta acicola]|uniref:Yippee domain-containing protein n=1 Tax=Lecanosticta acicola TaxID=111012 RepID=A0AAI8YZR2_9PEZI|nr:Hypothetical predicted protein [Lecanosticta acicola]